MCPECGMPRQWEMWRHCACGYDFGPGEQFVGAEQNPRQHAPDLEEDWLTEERIRKGFRYLFLGILTACLVSHYMHPMGWFVKAAEFILVVSVWSPCLIWKTK